jgi:hypothetical protein
MNARVWLQIRSPIRLPVCAHRRQPAFASHWLTTNDVPFLIDGVSCEGEWLKPYRSIVQTDSHPITSLSFRVGSFGEVVHFNGVNWNRYFGAVPIPSGALGRLAVTNRLVMTVGDISASRGIVLIGRR